MRELLYTILELEEWNQGATCRFCRGLNKAVCQIRTRSKTTHSIVENDYACESCKEKFESNELPKCERCGRLKTKSNIDFSSGKYICDCIKDNEDLEEKELPVLPHEERQSTFYERQINGLQEKLTTAENTTEEEREAHKDFMKVSEEWSKRQKQELLEENKELKEQNKKMTSGELINKMEFIEKEIAELKAQLTQLSSQQQTAQIEAPPKENKIKNLFKFSSK